jgi:hypothetical protein
VIVPSVSDLSVCRVLPELTPTTFLRDSLLTWHLPVMSLEMRLWVALYTMIIESIWEIVTALPPSRAERDNVCHAN